MKGVMISKETVGEILEEGRRIPLDEYAKHNPLNLPKTFYFFCKYLAEIPGKRYVLSPTINEFISTQIRAARIDITERFNANGWFSRLWTLRGDHFRAEYREVLERLPEEKTKESEKYRYRIDPRYKRMVRSVLSHEHLPGSLALMEDLQTLACSSNLSRTERNALQKTRIGQGDFRKTVAGFWNNKCAVTGFGFEALLIASHIKPWRESNNEERLDGFNGLMLSPNLDAAFDHGLITFTDVGKIQISRAFLESGASKLNIRDGLKLKKKLTEKHLTYLRYHQESVFKK